MKTDEHDGEYDSAVLVNITSSHTQDPGGRLRRRKGGERKLYRLRMTIPDVVMITRESVVSSSNGAGHHTAGVELQLGLKDLILFSWLGRLILCNFLDQRNHKKLMQRSFWAKL